MRTKKIQINDYQFYIIVEQRKITPNIYFDENEYKQFTEVMNQELSNYDISYIEENYYFPGIEVDIVFNNEDDFNIFLLEYN